MIHSRKLVAAGLAGALAVAGTLAASNAAMAWEPQKPADFIVMAGKGGGADKMARLMQSVIEKKGIASKPFVPINKPGGSGAEALLHMKNTKGANKDHTVMVTLNSFYTTPMRQPGLDVDISTFAPVARMAEDTFLLWVHKDSGIENIDQFVEAANAKGKDWIMAGTGRGQEDQLLTDFLNRAYGLSMKYVPFKGGGRVAKELAGKHADSTVNNPSEVFVPSGRGNVRLRRRGRSTQSSGSRDSGHQFPPPVRAGMGRLRLRPYGLRAGQHAKFYEERGSGSSHDKTSR